MRRRRRPPETPRPRDDIIRNPSFCGSLCPHPRHRARSVETPPHPEPVMARDQIDMTPLQSRDELVAWLEAGVKRPSEFRIGTEHEKTPCTLEGHEPVPYEGARGIGALLEGMQLLLGW